MCGIVCMQASTHPCMPAHPCIHSRIHASIHPRIRASMRPCIHALMQTNVCACACTCVDARARHVSREEPPRGQIDDYQAARIFKHVLSALKYLHSRYLIHRDLRPEQIYFKTKGPDAVFPFVSDLFII